MKPKLTLFSFLSFLIILLIRNSNGTLAQSSNCPLRIGTNLSSVYDYGTEIPFVDMMKLCREWYTKGVNDPTWEFNTGMAQYLTYDSNGYPTHLPQTIAQHPLPQYVCTIWAITDGWPPGTYTLLWDGQGDFSYAGPINSWTQTGPNTITFNFPNPQGGMLQLCITQSDINNPVRNIRLIMPGHVSTYQSQPFNPAWLQWVTQFNTVRFMDWGRTNNWGQADPWTPAAQGQTAEWNERSQTGFYTFTHSKGIPYEYMVKLMNDYDLDGWVCVPHNASNDYIQRMAEFFRDNLEPGRHLYVEYSNEIWNWIFGQTVWLYDTYNCDVGTNYWPECLVPAIQNNLNIWGQVFSGQMHRITRVVGMFTSWLDVSRRIAFNLNPSSFEAVSPTYYFGISETSDSLLDNMGASATVSFLAQRVRQDRATHEWVWIKQIVDSIAIPLNKKVCFYEGGQHITPIPFGVPSTYDQVLLDIQRDTAMYNLYVENYEYLKTIHGGSQPWLLMNFSLVTPLSAQYGSWGILETLYQDTTLIPAPKLSATLRYIKECNQSVGVSDSPSDVTWKIYPNPASDYLIVETIPPRSVGQVEIVDTKGNTVYSLKSNYENTLQISLQKLSAGTYLLKTAWGNKVFIKQ